MLIYSVILVVPGGRSKEEVLRGDFGFCALPSFSLNLTIFIPFFL
jgi:hypothetical protein